MNLHRIRSLLAAPNVSIPEVAKSTGVSIRTLFRIKSGESNINLRTYNALDTWAKGKRL